MKCIVEVKSQISELLVFGKHKKKTKTIVELFIYIRRFKLIIMRKHKCNAQGKILYYNKTHSNSQFLCQPLYEYFLRGIETLELSFFLSEVQCGVPSDFFDVEV